MHAVAGDLMRRLVGLVVAAALVAAAVIVTGPTPPASAAPCASATGVTVVVDFNQLGGGVQLRCDRSGGGDTAASLFTSNGFPLTYAQRQPGFVCRVSGVPASDPCVETSPSDAYWSLYWSDGKSGRWAYSSTSVGSLRIPEGGYVAFSWKQGSAPAQPSASASPHEAPPPPPPPSQPAQGPPAPSSLPPSPSASPSETVAPSRSAAPAKPDKKKTPRPKLRPKPSEAPTTPSTPTPTIDTGDVLAPTASPPDADDDGLPGWVAPGLIVLLFAAAAVTVVVRRRGAPGP